MFSRISTTARTTLAHGQRMTIRGAFRPLSSSSAKLSGSDYGSADGAPPGQKPHEQGPNPSEHLEHPGPKSPMEGSNSSSGSSGSASKSGGGLKTESEPADTEEARKHNEELDKRAHKQHHGNDQGKPAEKDFWKGDVGGSK